MIRLSEEAVGVKAAGTWTADARAGGGRASRSSQVFPGPLAPLVSPVAVCVRGRGPERALVCLVWCA